MVICFFLALGSPKKVLQINLDLFCVVVAVDFQNMYQELVLVVFKVKLWILNQKLYQEIQN